MTDELPSSTPNPPEMPPPEVVMPPPSALRMSLSTAAVLLVFTVLFTGLMSGAYVSTRPVIEASIEAEKLQLVGEVLPPAEYDNAPLQDAVTVPPLAALGTDVPSQVFRARKAGQPAALIFEAVAPDGYSGQIKLLLAVRADGQLAGVRVIEHHETPGLGDYVDIRKDKQKANPWVRQFDNQRFDPAAPRDFSLKKDGGRFDYRTGATISARAVTNAVARAMAFAVAHRAALFTATRGTQWSPAAQE